MEWYECDVLWFEMMWYDLPMVGYTTECKDTPWCTLEYTMVRYIVERYQWYNMMWGTNACLQRAVHEFLVFLHDEMEEHGNYCVVRKLHINVKIRQVKRIFH